MYIGIQDAVVIYARMCRARYKGRAKRIVSEHAQALLKRGDHSGAQVWQQVAVEIERLKLRAELDPGFRTAGDI